MRAPRLAALRRGVNWLAAGVGLSALTLAMLGYRAIIEWQHQAQMLSERNADAAADLLLTAITKDMHAVQSSVLVSLHVDGSPGQATLDLYEIGSVFARYPYPDAFFAAHGGPAPPLSFYTRSARPPAWLSPAPAGATFPVVQSVSNDVGSPLLTRIHVDAESGRRVSCFTIGFAGRSYQVVALLAYADRPPRDLESIVGFMVDLDWVRDHYFDDITSQVGRMSGPESGLQLAVLDGHGGVVSGEAEAHPDAPARSRPFQLLFFDPLLVELDPPRDLVREQWVARAAVFGDRALIAARRGASRLLGLVAASALAMAVGLTLTVRSEQARARLVEARSTFVSAVTHELKTPIASIRAIGETLASGRSTHPLMAREYAQMAVHESKRLTRLVDNLLAYSRISDVTEAYAFEAVDVELLIEHSLKAFQSQLTASGFAIALDIEPGLPPIRVDRSSMALVIDNLLDNAMRYSEGTREVTVAARRAPRVVRLSVADRGRGIPPEDLPLVTRRFFRGHGAQPASGSGLGLSIVDRIVSDHGGRLTIHSEVGVGTTITIALPEAAGDDEKADPGR